MKRIYEKPAAFVESFAANEYVAACYFLACEVGPGPKNASNGPNWHEDESGGVDHAKLGTPKTCADSSANRVLTSDGALETSRVGEYNGQQGWIDGGIDTWIDNGDGIVGADDMIYWYTTDGGSRRWNHYGVIKPTKEGHPNHS